jgi:drug/metabolite transporter (DMT)-like permease
MQNYVVLAFVVVLTVVADYALKYASLKISPFVSGWFVVGALLYAATAIGWIALMRTHDLAQIAVLYSSGTIIALTLLGIVSFGESLSTKQIIGLSAALLSVVLMESDA